MLTARRPGPALNGFCQRHGLVLIRISGPPGASGPAGPGTEENGGWIDARLAGHGQPGGLRALILNPGLTVIVRPDRVIAAAGTRSRLPQLPWYIPATAARGHAAASRPPAHPDSAGPLSAAL